MREKVKDGMREKLGKGGRIVIKAEDSEIGIEREKKILFSKLFSVEGRRKYMKTQPRKDKKERNKQ